VSISNGNGGGTISTRTVMTIALGIIQSLLVGAGYVLYDQLQDTNTSINSIQQDMGTIQLQMTREIGAIDKRVGILESK
jgi:hypothetical protein